MMARTPPERTPRKPPRRSEANNETKIGPPRPLYLPMRYVTFEEYNDIWPDENGSPYPERNHEYPSMPSYWLSYEWRDINHTRCFYEWLILKNIEPKWFHQDTTTAGKVRILTEYRDSWRDGTLMPPKRLWIKNYGGHRYVRPMSSYPKVNRLTTIIEILTTKLIDWLNKLTGATEPTNDDPLGIIGEWVSTKFEMGAGDFRYGSRFYIKSFNSRKQHYVTHCPPMGNRDVKLSVQTLISFEASIDGKKKKHPSEQMASLSELFEGYEYEKEMETNKHE
jgi:hypothetical protein